MLNLVPSQDGGARRTTFELLYKEHFRAIYAYCLRRVPLEEVPDLVAEVFTTAWRRVDDLPPRPEDRLWLYGVARRTASQHHRGRVRRERVLTSLRHNFPRSSILSDDTSLLESRVVELVDHLRPKDRELVRLIVWEQLTPSEAAKVFGCSVNAVSIRWHRSLRRLRRNIGTGADLLPSVPEDDFRHPQMGGL